MFKDRKQYAAPMTDSKQTILYRWFNELWNNKMESTIDKLLSDNVVFYNLAGEKYIIGIKNFKTFYQQFRQDFTDFYVDVGEVSESGDTQSAVCMVEATDTLSGTKIEFSDKAMMRIENGKITASWNHFDELCYQLRETNEENDD